MKKINHFIIFNALLLSTSTAFSYCAVPMLTPVTTCVEVQCSAGGNHSPGDLCHGQDHEQPYTYCTTTWLNDGCLYYQGSGSGGSGSGSSTGGGGSSSGNNNPQIPPEESMTLNECGVNDDTGANDPSNDFGVIDHPLDSDPSVLCDMSFELSASDCIHNKLILPESDNMYKDMLATFNDFSYTINFQAGDLNNPPHDLGLTTTQTFNGPSSGPVLSQLPDRTVFTITIDNEVDDSDSFYRFSNLNRTMVLIHEVVHAYMNRQLIEANVIAYDQYGNGGIINHGTSNFPITPCDLSSTWYDLTCDAITAQENANLDPAEASHQLFTTAIYSGTTTYRQAIEDFLLNNHDWDNESLLFESVMQNFFNVTDDSWKHKTAEYLSWTGLHNTAAFRDWLNSEGITQLTYYNVFIQNIRFFGNGRCTD